jgi:hypothetical protein
LLCQPAVIAEDKDHHQHNRANSIPDDRAQCNMQISRFGAASAGKQVNQDATPNGGSARDYLPDFAWLGARSWGNARAAVRMFIHRAPSV